MKLKSIYKRYLPRLSPTKVYLLVLFCFVCWAITFHSFLPKINSNMSSSSDQSSVLNQPRSIVKRVITKAQNEGDGAVVRRSIGSMQLNRLDPFLLLDDFSVSAPAGFPDHPHRGFETVTYMFEGAFTHQDFAGNKGTIRPGDVQWMTAGRGIVHSEMPAGDEVSKGLQLWINLSSENKMIEPRYQDMLKEDIKRAETDGVEVRIIAGESMGVKSPVFTRTPTMYLDFTLKPGAEWHQSIPESWNAFVYTIEGEGVFGSADESPAEPHQLLLLGPGDGVKVWNKSSKPLRFALIGGQPLNEPIAQYGPFVMNTKAEIQKTFEDYRFYKNGFENARHWKSVE
ncbi:pirin-like protein [Telopea speciosissima]|uniref:pirin-like protein n=1 Tax=Telopea speciosissima TaxID=54955 RepID=UPI001CC436B6|nr:pirin-like protein [Telopea speciosissima]